jgi:ABC-type amino acid transport substrate-binding protein
LKRRRLFLLVAVILLLVGCEDLASLLPEEDEGPPAAFVAPTPVPTFPPALTTSARILDRGVLVVGVRYDLEPLSFIAPDSQLAGLEIDLARELARRWLGSPDAVRFVQVRTDTAFDHLTEGSVDLVLGGVIHTQAGEANADFAGPYFMDGMALLTFPDTGIRSLGELQSSHRVGVLDWTESLEAVQAATPVTATYVSYGHFFDVLDGLRNREIDVYADQHHRLVRARRSVAGTTVVGQWTWAPVAPVFRQDDPFFANVVRLTMQDMVADGTRDALYARWLPETSPPSLTMLPGQAPTPAMEASPQRRPDLDIIERMRQRGSIAVGYFQDRWPYSADRADGVPTGFEVRLLERLAELWFGSREAVTYVPVTEADATNRLAQGEVDVLVGAWVHTRERELGWDFSIPILDDGVSLFSLDANPVEGFDGLGGQSVGVVVGSAGEAAVPQLSQGVGMNAVGYPTFGEAVAALQAGEVIAILTERRPALDVHFRQEGFHLTNQRYTYRPVAYMLPEGDSAYRDLFNLSLMELEARGVYQELYGLWFDDPIPSLGAWPGIPTVPLVVNR